VVKFRVAGYRPAAALEDGKGLANFGDSLLG
jgi:hypothetical protein